MNVDDAVKAIETRYGDLYYNDNHADQFSCYTSKINSKFWDDVRGICTKKHLKLKEFIINAFVLYFLQLNGEMSEEDSKKFINPNIKDASNEIGNINNSIDSLTKSVTETLEKLQGTVNGLDSKFNVLTALFGTKIAQASVQ